MTHPLTDGMIEEIKSDVFSQAPKRLTPGLRSEWSSDCMRAAADWQLEQVIEWLNFGWQTDPNLSREMKQRGGFSKIAIALEKAMRPQEDTP